MNKNVLLLNFCYTRKKCRSLLVALPLEATLFNPATMLFTGRQVLLGYFYGVGPTPYELLYKIERP